MGTQNGQPETATSPPAISPNSTNFNDAHPKKGWFPVNTAPPIRQNNHNLKYKLSNGPPIARNDTAALSRNDTASFSPQEGDPDEPMKLPFASDRLLTTPRAFSPTRRSPSRNSGQNGSNLNHSQSNFGAQSTLTTGFEESDNLMVELLSGQAVVEAKEYGILQWDEMAEIKKVRYRSDHPEPRSFVAYRNTKYSQLV